MFNGCADVQPGRCVVRVITTNHPSAPLAPVPHCTQSQLIGYFDKTRRRIATAHQYLKPDGSLGASGLPDPKSLLIGDELFLLDKGK
jgi:hypothetical protein